MTTTQRSLEAGQRFLLAAKRWWTSDLYQQLRSEYESQAGAKASRHKVADVAAVLEDTTQYRYFAWLERHLQRMKYSGAYGLARFYDQERDKVLPTLPATDKAREILELHPELPLPKYYTDVDIHQHPGGVWSDEVAGFVYEHGARGTTPLLGGAHADLHTRFTSLVAEKATPSKILDVGCGSTASISRRPACGSPRRPLWRWARRTFIFVSVTPSTQVTRLPRLTC